MKKSKGKVSKKQETRIPLDVSPKRVPNPYPEITDCYNLVIAMSCLPEEQKDQYADLFEELHEKLRLMMGEWNGSCTAGEEE